MAEVGLLWYLYAWIRRWCPECPTIAVSEEVLWNFIKRVRLKAEQGSVIAALMPAFYGKYPSRIVNTLRMAIGDKTYSSNVSYSQVITDRFCKDLIKTMSWSHLKKHCLTVGTLGIHRRGGLWQTKLMPALGLQKSFLHNVTLITILNSSGSPAENSINSFSVNQGRCKI